MGQNLSHKVRRFILWTVTAILLAACTGGSDKSGYQYQPPADLDDGWQTASLQDYGMDNHILTDMVRDIEDGGYESLHSLLIVKNGRLVFEQYFQGYGPNWLQPVASVTKSVTSILIGIAIDQGAIKGVDQPLSELLPEYRELLNADPRKQKLQLWHILTMTSGLEWDEETYPYGDFRNDATRLERSPDAVQFVLDRPMAYEPGTQFQYCAGNSMLLSAILERATGVSARQFAQAYLFEPLGIRQYQWASYADGHTNSDGGLSLLPRDMAKIGQLMLNGGSWNGAPVVSPAWVAESTRARTSAGLLAQYGYQWWRDNQAVLLESVDSYFAAGFGAQLISVYPGQAMVIVFTNDLVNHDENSIRVATLRRKYVLPAAVPAVPSRILLGSWYLLSAASLGYLFFAIFRRQLAGSGLTLSWLLVGAAFGPLGLGTYLLSYQDRRTNRKIGWKALGLASFFAMGHLSGFILVMILQALVVASVDAILLVIPASFLVNWLVFIAPLVSGTKGIPYWRAIWRTKLTAFITACFALAGSFPLLIGLTIRWFQIGVDLSSPLCWVMLTVCGLVAVVMVYPFSLWLIHRNPELWSVSQIETKQLVLAEHDRRLPGLRNAWGVFLLALICLIGGFGVTVMILS